MEEEIKLIWQTAINLGFKFNESDANEMWYQINKLDIKKKQRQIEDYYNHVSELPTHAIGDGMGFKGQRSN
jgi:hypothetical protein